jgi:bis(5'-nucleosyl)-tetraphosphatase (symmetrical)
MAIYLVGDIQGCFDELIALLAKANFTKDSDTLYVAGDLVARGPKSLETLRFIKSLGESAKVVLGNHDLHLLAVYEGIKNPKPEDLLSTLLHANDIDELIDWLASQPLIQAIPNKGTSNVSIEVPFAYMSHAGIAPQWQLTDALTQAKNIQGKLSSVDRKWWLTKMYGEQPNSWHLANTEVDKFRFSINALTRMRYCFNNGNLEFTQKNSPQQNNISTLQPWYDLSKTIDSVPWVFGHWASIMGNCSHHNIYPLDTGCVWGNKLTLLRWHDKKYYSVNALVN